MREQVENAIKILETKLSEAEDIDKEHLRLKEHELELREFEKTLQNNKKDIDKLASQQEQEKEYIAKMNKEIELKQIDLEENKQLLLDIQKVTILLDEKKKEVKKEQDILEEKKKEYKNLEKREKEVKDQLDLIEKEKVIDRERKAQLTLGETALKREQNRLQKIAEGFKIT